MAAVKIISPAYGLLAELTVAVLHYYQARGPMPSAIAEMLPCVGDALASHDDDYIELMHALFSLALEDVLFRQKERRDADSMQRINIVKASLGCQGLHVDPEHCLVNGHWQRTDHDGGAVIEIIERREGETDIAFFDRVNIRASELDRELHCPRCYRK
jgi:hypothetical protein